MGGEKCFINHGFKITLKKENDESWEEIRIRLWIKLRMVLCQDFLVDRLL